MNDLGNSLKLAQRTLNFLVALNSDNQTLSRVAFTEMTFEVVNNPLTFPLWNKRKLA